MKKLIDVIKTLPEYIKSLSIGAISVLSTLLLLSEWRRKKAYEKTQELERKEDLREITNDVKKEDIDKSIDRFYDDYKHHKSERK